MDKQQYSSVVNLLSDSETEEDTKNTTVKSSFGDKKDTSCRLEPRAMRSQTRAKGGVKQLNDTKLSDGKKECESLRQQSGESQINETILIDDDLLDIDQTEVEPLSSVQDALPFILPTVIKTTAQRFGLSNAGDNKKVEKVTIQRDYNCLLGKTNDEVSVETNAFQDAITLRHDSSQNTLTTHDGKPLKQHGRIEIKGSSIRCIDSRKDSKFVSLTNHPMEVVNKIKKPFNMKFASEQINKTNDIQISNTDVNKPIRLNNSSLNVVKLIDSSCSLPADDVVIIDDDININEDNRTTMKAKELLSKVESKAFSSTVSSNSKSTTLQLDEKINKNDKTPWNMFGKAQNILDTTKKQCLQDSSLYSNETEERINTAGVDQDDSTIGAFDTFAQITRVRQKSFTSKDIKDTKEKNIEIPVMMKKEEDILGMNRNQIIEKKNLADMESFLKKNLLTTTLIKNEPIDECDDHIFENDTNIERELIESRKAPTNDDYETFNLRERGIMKCMGLEGKTSKEIETNSTEVKMITKTRGLKVEEKLKESYVYKNVSTKLRPQIKYLGSPSYSGSSTSIENPSIPSHEYKKKLMNTDDNSKRNTTSKTLYDNKNNRDINIDPSVIVRKENLNREVIGIPRTLTLSSSFNQKITLETTSSKQDQDNVKAIIPKETVLTKTIVSNSTYPDHQTTRSRSPPKTLNEHTLNEINCGRTLFIPLEMLSKSQIPLHKVHQRSVNNFIKQQEIKPTHDQIQKQTVTTTQLDKPLPKKRGRKRRIDLPTEKQESNSRNRTSQNAAKCNTSIKEVEPPAKRTRRSLGLRGRKKEAMNNYAQPRSTTVEPRQSKKQCVEKSNENNETCKRLMKFVFNNLCEKSKYISTLNKEVTDIPPPYAGVIKCPIEARDIKRKIATGEIRNLAELQVNLLLLSYNALMINRSDSIVFNDAINFQSDLLNICRELNDAVGENYGSSEDGTMKKPDHSIKMRFPDLKCSKTVKINKETFDDILLKYTDLTSDESTDSDDSD
ncbi:unnamed protein product [Macrosiphum euphorbiae]|uniref:Bromo domain-containing protein n=1 Tax=Macrosiphum euphorbiae TaxID=13131 RepID=A0AAV0WQ13_9HEMI|nr:unnamed protein product [Macrosiphum euphorbiae]